MQGLRMIDRDHERARVMAIERTERRLAVNPKNRHRGPPVACVPGFVETRARSPASRDRLPDVARDA